MATLVLTTVGAVLGGPIGAAVGAVAGAQVDRAILAPRGRQGPRLGDLAVQTSSYGNRLPRLFGTMRVSGTVIWATGLREDRHNGGGGKSGRKTTSYSYSCSFAVALSARAIRSVGRIWADGKLLRGSGGDWKSEIAAFRLHPGSEDQTADPLIASAEGVRATPAHRGVAYAVFEGLQLADFGNRVPSLTFEVTADPGDVALATIARELSDGAIVGDGGATLGGFAASGDSVRGALEALATAWPMALSDDGAVLRLNPTATTDLPIALLGAGAGDAPGAVRRREHAPAGTLPDAVTLAYYEPARDYQAGLQSARRDGIGRRATRIDLPVAVAADAAKLLAEAALDRAWTEREQAAAVLPWRMMRARAGTLATLDGARWRIAGWSLDRMALHLTLRRVTRPSVAPAAADPGRSTGDADAVPGATSLVLLDLPAFDDSAAAAPQMWLAAAGTGAGWRRASVSVSLDGGAGWQALGQTAPPAVIGSAATALADGSPRLFDRRGTVEVELLHDGMALQGAGDDALVAGANLAVLGDEILQFGAATQVGARRYRLQRLLRGRRGSEWATGGHVAGEPFVLLDAATLLPIPVPLGLIGGTVLVMAAGPGDTGPPATAARTIEGRAVRPPAPVHLSAARLADGTIRLRWVRRSRIGWAWLDGGDVPLGEDGDRYRVRIAPVGGAGRTVEIEGSAYNYPPAAQAADGVARRAPVEVEIAALGARAASRPPAVARFTL